MAEISDVPSRVLQAEQRDGFRALLDASSLGDPEAKEAIARRRAYTQALPDRWMRLADLPHLLSLYRDRRETWGENHEVATAYVLAEVDYEPDQSDLDGVET